MKNNKKILKKINLFLKNYFLTTIVLVIIGVGIISIYKTAVNKSTYYYAKIQVNYPASYFSKPDFWIAQSLKRNIQQVNAFGNTEAEIISTRYYPNNDGTSFNIYLITKLYGKYDEKKQEFKFQNTKIGVGSPITLNLSSTQISGTIIKLNLKQIDDKYTEKLITLVNRGNYYEDDPTLYNNIKIDDKYFDGEDYIFQIIDKKHEKNIIPVANNLTGLAYSAQITATENLIIKAKIKVLQENGLYIFAGNQVLREGSKFLFSTPSFDLTSYIINDIE